MNSAPAVAASLSPELPADEAELRVIGGPRVGAALPLTPGATVRLATSFGADIVLRDPSTPFAATLLPDAGRAIRLTVESGTAELLGLPLEPGQHCIWPPFTPLRFGPHLVAHGAAASERWADALALAHTGAAPAEEAAPPPVGVEGGWHQRARAAWAGLPRGLRRPIGGGLAIAAMLAAVAAAPQPSFPGFWSSPERARNILEEQGLAGLEVARSPDGVVRISGAVQHGEQVALAAAGLDAAGIVHAIDLTTGEELASAAEDVARIKGVAADARAIGPRDIRLTIAPVDPDRRAALVRAIRTDVPDIGRLVVDDGLAATDAEAPRSVSEAAKRVATVVAGDPGYVLTADGGRYFPGALLPSGHVLRAVEDGAILVERNGATTRIRF